MESSISYIVADRTFMAFILAVNVTSRMLTNIA